MPAPEGPVGLDALEAQIESLQRRAERAGHQQVKINFRADDERQSAVQQQHPGDQVRMAVRDRHGDEAAH